MDEATVTLLAAVRPMLKGHIRRTRDLLAYLTELDKRLDAYSREAERDTEDARPRIAV